jgi:hypothetical protein
MRSENAGIRQGESFYLQISRNRLWANETPSLRMGELEEAERT